MTYCSPKIVFGRICAETLRGISFTLSGSSSSVTVTQVICSVSQPPFGPESTLTSPTVPTIRPRTLTSEPRGRLLPVWSVFSVTFTTSVNVLL